MTLSSGPEAATRVQEQTTSGEVSPLLETELASRTDPSPLSQGNFFFVPNRKKYVNIHQDERALNLADSHRVWLPKALERKSLLAFIAIYVALIATLVALFWYSNKYNGLSPANQKLRYLWTYAPTALFTLVASLWTKIEYHCKQLAPWQSLAKGNASAQRSLSLDYVSAWNIKALFLSAKKKHFSVTLAILGGLSLQLMMIFSTGLFALEQRTMFRDDVALTTRSRFANVSSDDVDGRAFLNAIGIRQFELEYPYGTTETFAYQKLDISGLGVPTNATISATVDALVPDLECNVVKASYGVFPSMIGYNHIGLYGVELNVSSSECPYFYNSDWTNTYLEEPLFNISSLAGYIALDAYGPCRNLSDTWEFLPEKGYKWWLWVGHTEFDNRTYYWNITIPNRGDFTGPYRNGTSSATCIECTSKIRMGKAIVTTNGRTVNASLIPDTLSPVPAKISPWAVLEKTKQSESQAHGILSGTNNNILHAAQNVTFGRDFFSLMNLTMPRYAAEDWMDSDSLIASARKGFQSTATQYIMQHLSQEFYEYVTSSAVWTENRLVLRPLSFYLIIALLVALLCITTTLLFVIPPGVLPRDPGSLAGIVAIVAASPVLRLLLRGVSHSETETQSRLEVSAPFRSVLGQDDRGHYFRVDAAFVNTQSPTVDLPNPEQQIQWWAPFGVTILGKAVVVTLPLLGITTLEILYQTSRRRDGIAEVPSNRYVQYTWVYIPALIVWGLNLCFESMYFLSTVFQPYHFLRRGSVTAEETLTRNLLSRILIHNTWSSLRKGRFAVFFTSLAVLLGAILPIAVAGLYTAEPVQGSLSLQLRPRNHFNASLGFYPVQQKHVPKLMGPYGDTNFETPRNGYPLANLIMYSNLSFPKWTIDTFALEELLVPDQHKGLLAAGTKYSTISSIVPAVRARANCTVVPEADVTWEERNKTMILRFNATEPEICGTHSAIFDNVPSGVFFFGQLKPADMNNDWPNWNGSATDATYHGRKDRPKYCPMATFTFGEAQPRNTDDHYIHSLTTMHCWPYVEKVLLDTTFSLPEFDIKSVKPLPPDPTLPGGYPFFSEAEILQNAGYPVPDTRTDRPIPFGNFFPEVMSAYQAEHYKFDIFTQTMIWGKDGLRPSELLSSKTVDRLMARIDQVYGIVMAQLYHSQARIPSAPDATMVEAQVPFEDHYRVVQSVISTRILQSVLATIILCMVATFFFLDTRELLPQNPCSIGAVASLFAGSKLVESGIMPRGSEFLDDGEMTKEGIFEGLRFRLGWWDEEDGERRRFGIDVENSSDVEVKERGREVQDRETGGQTRPSSLSDVSDVDVVTYRNSHRP